MKKIFLVALLMVLMLTGTVMAAGKLRIGVAVPTADHGWTAGIDWWAQKAINDWKAKDPNLEFFLVTAASPAEQVSQVEDLMVKGIDALVILAHASAPVTPIVKKAYNSGIFVVSVDRGLTEPVQNIYVAGDNPGFGKVTAQWMAKALGGKGKIVVLEGIPCVINTERVDAFKAVMKEYPGIKILASQPAYWQTQKGLEVMENYLQRYSHIDGVWAADDDTLKGVLQAYKESGRTDIKVMIGGGGSKDIIKMIMDGSNPVVRADVTYPPSMIATAISAAVMAMRGEMPGSWYYQHEWPTKIILPSELVTQKNAAKYYQPNSIY